MRGILLVFLASSAIGAENLLTNSGFEFGYGPAGNADAWTYRSSERLVVERTADQPHGGNHALRLAVGADHEVTWYQVGQEMAAPRSRLPLTLSGWVRTREVRDGVGAYLSLNFFDAGGKRTGYFDSRTVVGTQDYQRLTVSGAPPPGSSRL
ncbi:MAG: hypothetical protein HUU35_09620, partial [Armatimonadetes bacterium]|nr:hypothetical protein [Armatimonadota bacterium]